MAGTGNRPIVRQGQVDRAVELVDRWVSEGTVPGVSLAIMLDGELVLEHAAGKAAAGGGGPVTSETQYPVASLTKPLTAATTLRLIEGGDLYLDEPIRRWVPAFATGPNADNPARRQITVRELLCHVAGLPKDDPAAPNLWAREADFADVAASATSIPSVLPTGRKVGYSNVGYWVLGAVIAAATTSPFHEIATSEILRPAGLTEATFAPDANREIARRYGPTRLMNTSYGRGLGSPAGGLFATARDMARFAGLFIADGRTANGSALLSSAAVERMTTDQTQAAAMPLPGIGPDPEIAGWQAPVAPLPGGITGVREWPSCPWAFGWEIRGDKRAHWTGDLASSATICHIGQSGCLAWADPASGLAVAILANRDLGTGWATGGRPERSPGGPDAPARWARLNDVIATIPVRSPAES